MANNRNSQSNSNKGIEGRLEALTALVAGLLRAVTKDQKSKQASMAEDRAITVLFYADVPQLEIRKILGVDTYRVNNICKKLKKQK